MADAPGFAGSTGRGRSRRPSGGRLAIPSPPIATTGCLLLHAENPYDDSTDFRNTPPPPHARVGGHRRAISAVEASVPQVDKLGHRAVFLVGIVGIGGFEGGK